MKCMMLVVCLIAVAGFVRADDALLASFGFDEAGGSVADDASANGLEATLSSSAQWATGTFGSALGCGAPGACAEIGEIPGLDGLDACTLFLRFRRTGSDSGKNACLLMTSGWVGKGGFLFHLIDSSLSVRLRAGGEGPETSVAAFAPVPEEKWCSVALVLKRPQLAVYADGKFVGTRKWDFPMRSNDVCLGAWHASSFGGFIDDFRAWKRALSAAEIAELAEDSRYVEVEGYQDDGTGGVRKTVLVGQEGQPCATLKNAQVTTVFDTLGRLSSLRENASGRELVSNAVSFVSLKADGKRLSARRLEKKGENLVFVFPRKRGEVELAVKPFDGGWAFEVVRSTVAAAQALTFGCVVPACVRWQGDFVNAWSDERSAVAVRSGDLYANPVWRDRLGVAVDAGRPHVGRTAYLAAGPRAGFRDQLKAMTLAAGVPHSENGGAWAMESDEARRSYFFIYPFPWEMDRVISLAYRGGFSILHFGSWTESLGHYEPRERQFPGGLSGMKACVDHIHAAGLKAGIHTLTACIANHDAWITPLCNTNLWAHYTYTLAEPFDGTTNVVYVNELPGPKHSLIATYTTEGNYLRFGNELMQYTGIRREKPYAFTGITRGACNTTKGGPYPKGMAVDYPRNHYIAFYPKPDSPLADELAARLGNVYRTCGLDEFYFDGSEGMYTRYGTDVMRHKIFKEISEGATRGPLIEASCRNANNWWFQTRMATTDHGVWGVKRFHDWHVRTAVESSRMANFLEPQMGWWQPRVAVKGRIRGHYPDEMEYFASQNAGNDAAMSVQGVHENPVGFSHKRQLTVLGWYEWPRLARAFNADAVAAMKVPGDEFRLRQDEDGVWTLAPCVCTYHRADLPWLMSWNRRSDAAASASLRVEALFAVKPYDDAGAKTVWTSADVKDMKTASAKDVTVALSAGADPEHGGTIRLTAANESAPQKGAWVRCEKNVAMPYLHLGKASAFGFWVKGDGSGALLNFVCRGAREYHGGTSDHYVRLDFTGWRYVTVALRERDGYENAKYVWPYSGSVHDYLRTIIDTKHVLGFSLYLNDIAPGRRATVEVSEVRALECVPTKAEGLSVEIGGVRHAVPFALASGDCAELEDGWWTHYAEDGEPVARAAATSDAALAQGDNKLAVSGKFANGLPLRTEVTVFAHGEAKEAFVDELTAEMRAGMTHETVMPLVYAPAKGFDGKVTLAVRPDEEAALSLEILGPVERPSFSWKKWFGRETVTFPTSVGKGQMLVCRNGVDWKVVNVDRWTTVAEGKLDEPIPIFDGVKELTFSSAAPEKAFAVIDIIKEYHE